jgi:cytochrome c-type biogenesis protein CcmF
MSLAGELTLSFAVLASSIALLASIAAARFSSLRALAVARWAVGGIALMFAISSVVLFIALLGGEYSVDYVARFTDRGLPTGYKLAAFWAGQEGSLLLWALLLAILSTIAVFTLDRAQSIGQSAATIGTLAVVCAFFALLILFAANPFAPAPQSVTDGVGMNPMLQDPAMIAHPPLLFMGYAAFTIPFAIMIGALIVGRQDDQWIDATRRWALFAWLFLTVGIVLGAQWAYLELGWGGYWGWDPVENASLLPWLTATAFVHSIMVQQHRSMFRIWNAGLLAATFVLCVFGTYLTRSGLVDSVHGFGESLVGTFFLVFLMTVVVFCIVLILIRVRRLRSNRKIESLISREGAFLAANILLCAMTAVVLVGTLYPVISHAITGTSTTLGPPFYNRVVAPAGLVLIGLMSFGPLLIYGKEGVRKSLRGSVPPTVLALIAAGGAWIIGYHSPWAMLAAAIAAGAITCAAVDFVHALIVRSRKENFFLALVRLVDGNHRRYGAQIVHLAMVLIMIGITGSSVFSQSQTLQLNPGQSTDIAGFHLTLDTISQARQLNYMATEAVVNVTDVNGNAFTLKPQRRVYDKWEEQTSSVVAIGSNWKRDLYLNLAGWDEGGSNVAIQVFVNPLVNWIWIGGWVLAIGAVFCMVPSFESMVARIAQPETDSRPSAHPSLLAAH